VVAAIFARRITDQHVADEAKSVTRQKAKAATPAAAKGMTPQRAIAWVRVVLILTVGLAVALWRLNGWRRALAVDRALLDGSARS